MSGTPKDECGKCDHFAQSPHEERVGRDGCCHVFRVRNTAPLRRNATDRCYWAPHFRFFVPIGGRTRKGKVKVPVPVIPVGMQPEQAKRRTGS